MNDVSRRELPPLSFVLSGLTANAVVGFVAVLLAGIPALRALVCGVSAAMLVTVAGLLWILLAPSKGGA
ncbi:hypothetical protein LCGC14_2600130 [marine sediment metagenome]|uniref:Uncharacterized protein n=1 Tax=marine sediment metagenome TaxID=412755 RepID=A0A0F9AWP6_9ZZZZ